jgi:hypothetical protein
MAAEVRPEHVAPLVAALRHECCIDEGRVRDAVAARRSFNVIELTTMTKVDVFVSRGRAFDRSAFDRLTPEVLDTADAARRWPELFMMRRRRETHETAAEAGKRSDERGDVVCPTSTKRGASTPAAGAVSCVGADGS